MARTPANPRATRPGNQVQRAHVPHGAAPAWGVAAAFETPGAMLAAVRALHAAGLGRVDAFSPVPVAGVAEALPVPRRQLRTYGLIGAALGGAGMFGMCTYATVYAYRFNIGGRPQFAWQAFMVPTFSSAMMGGTLAVMAALFVLNRLPRLNHPAFNIPEFGRATDDRFFVAVEAGDDRFDVDRVEAMLDGLPDRPLTVSRVPR